MGNHPGVRIPPPPLVYPFSFNVLHSGPPSSATIVPSSSYLRRALGAEWQARFESFEHEAAAAASLGQVHRAVALDGRALACKLQYPDNGWRWRAYRRAGKF